MSAAFLTPFGDGSAEFIERRSRFIGYVWRVETEQRALELLVETRKRHADAAHNVYAYALRDGERGAVTRFSDDGEPSGTAGRPVLEVFTREDITNYLCVVTRYFGGILLGAGGLVRAYAAAAKAGLDAAGIAEMRLCSELSLTFDYALYERVKLEIEAAGGVVTGTDYAADVNVALYLPAENTDGFSLRLAELSAGRIVPATTGERYIPVRVR